MITSVCPFFRVVSRAALLGATILSLPSAGAALVFTFELTAFDDGHGYANGVGYTLSFTLADAFADNSNSSFTTAENAWVEELASEDSLWSAAGGDAVVGTYVRDTSTADAPRSRLFQSIYEGNTYLEAVMSSELGPIGLTTLDGTAIKSLYVTAETPVLLDEFPGFHVQPAAHHASFAGTYATLPGSSLAIGLVSGDAFSLRLDRFHIQSAPVPEPAAAAALFGVSSLWLVALRRRPRA